MFKVKLVSIFKFYIWYLRQIGLLSSTQEYFSCVEGGGGGGVAALPFEETEQCPGETIFNKHYKQISPDGILQFWAHSQKTEPFRNLQV